MEMRIGNRLDEMPAIAAMVEEFGVKHSIPSAVVNEINLVLDEVVSNIISYGYSEDATGQIIVKLRYQPGEICVEVQDDGKAFDPLQAGRPDMSGTVQTRKVGGLGIYFVKELMDDVSYARVGNENLLAVKKKIPV
jgi:serine/threonine-protein kinase RsbW